ncbi:Dynactin subunit 4, partial [Fasciola gigantica]
CGEWSVFGELCFERNIAHKKLLLEVHGFLHTNTERAAGMTTYMELDQCQVLCACLRAKSICRLYFCRHCLDVRCGECVSHEVDSHYCPNCLENMASAEAKMRKHRCGNCFDCPSCGHTLSTRATAVMLAKPDDPGKTVAQKAYYLTCGFCRWSTRDSNIPDQRQSAGGWQESNNPHSKRISELIDSYHHLAVREKADREWSKFVRKRNYMILLERYPVLNPRLRRYCSSSWTTPNRDTEPAKKINIPAAEAPVEPVQFDVEPFISQPLQLESITTVRQRHLAPQLQPNAIMNNTKFPKCLVVKRSMRCRQCEHNLSKADFNPSSIKFRINLSALYHVPEIRYILITAPVAEAQKSVKPGELQRRTSTTMSSLKSEHLIQRDYKPGKTQHAVLTICNPAHRVTTVTLRQLTAEEETEKLNIFFSLQNLRLRKM